MLTRKLKPKIKIYHDQNLYLWMRGGGGNPFVIDLGIYRHKDNITLKRK